MKSFLKPPNFPFIRMKLPKTVKRHCPFCKKHTTHSIKNQSFKGLNKNHTMSRGSKTRVRARGLRRGFGNLGRFSKGALSSWKRYGKKTTKKTDLRYTCKECNKTHVQKKGIRTKRVEFT
jgi:large subunit ribosomal protein L44e